MIQHYYVEQLERDLGAMTKDRDGLKAALLAQVKQQSDSMRNWAKESAALKIRVGVLERENAALHRLASDMAAEMEQHGGELAFDSLARYRAEVGKEAKP